MVINFVTRQRDVRWLSKATGLHIRIRSIYLLHNIMKSIVPSFRSDAINDILWWVCQSDVQHRKMLTTDQNIGTELSFFLYFPPYSERETVMFKGKK